MNEPKVIPFASQEAARPETLSGWVSSRGFFYHGDRAEESARFDGCTHRPCQECGTPTEKMWLCCSECRAKHDAEKWAKRERSEWDETTPLYLEAVDRYAFSVDEVEDEMRDSETSFDNLRPLLCERKTVSLLEADHWCDDIPEDGEAPDELIAAIEVFNAAVAGVTMCWEATDTVATWEDAPEVESLLVEAET